MLLDNVRNIYSILIEENNTKEGLYERRLLPEGEDSLFSIFIGIKVPARLYYFSVSLPSELITLIKPEKTTGLHIETINNGVEFQFSIILEDPIYSDIFPILAADLIAILFRTPDQKKALILFNNKLLHWKSFFKESRPGTLNKNELVGLIGELIVLKELLFFDDSIETLGTWKGPFKQKNDFISDTKSIEVKTSLGKSSHSVQISSEFQLDSYEINNLMLAHVVIENDSGASKKFTINDLINELIDNKNDAWVATFYLILKAAGYEKKDSHFYSNDFFNLYKINIYNVNSEFPKICKSEIHNNISNVKYELLLTGFENLLMPKEKTLKEFIFI